MRIKSSMCPKKLCIDSFCHSFQCSMEQLPEGIPEKLASINSNFRLPNQSELEQYILEILERINATDSYRNQQDNLIAWETGWSENLADFMRDHSEEHLRPKYFRASRFFRYNKTIVVPENLNIEFDLFSVAREFLFKHYFSQFDHFYELGCGSGQNIFFLSQLFPDKKIFGLDWSEASIKIVDLIGRTFGRNVKGILFDMINPSAASVFKKNSVFFSIHALEQIGKSHGKLLEFLLEQKPALVLHYEPILELYDTNNLYDYLAIMYSQKRGYLSGYLTALRELEACGKIEIMMAHRPCIGGVYHEASVIIWRPVT